MQDDTGDAGSARSGTVGPGGGFSVRLATMEDADGVTAALEAAFPVLARDHYDPEVLPVPAPDLSGEPDPVAVGNLVRRDG